MIVQKNMKKCCPSLRRVCLAVSRQLGPSLATADRNRRLPLCWRAPSCRQKKTHNHLSVNQWLRSAIFAPQQHSSPIGFQFLKLPPPPCAALLVFPYYFPILSLFFPYLFPIISVLFPYYFPIFSIFLPYFFPIISLLFPYYFPIYFPIFSLLFPFYFSIISLLFANFFPIISLFFPYFSLLFPYLFPIDRSFYDYRLRWTISICPSWWEAGTFDVHRHPATRHLALWQDSFRSVFFFGRRDGLSWAPRTTWIRFSEKLMTKQFQTV